MKVFFDRQESHFKRLWTLEQWYSDLRGYLPLFMEKEQEKYTAVIYPKLVKLDAEIDAAWDEYEQRFDDEGTWNPAELVFNKRVKMILRDLDEITALTKVIDKQTIDEGVIRFGGGI